MKAKNALALALTSAMFLLIGPQVVRAQNPADLTALATVTLPTANENYYVYSTICGTTSVTVPASSTHSASYVNSSAAIVTVTVSVVYQLEHARVVGAAPGTPISTNGGGVSTLNPHDKVSYSTTLTASGSFSVGSYWTVANTILTVNTVTQSYSTYNPWTVSPLDGAPPRRCHSPRSVQ